MLLQYSQQQSIISIYLPLIFQHCYKQAYILSPCIYDILNLEQIAIWLFVLIFVGRLFPLKLKSFAQCEWINLMYILLLSHISFKHAQSGSHWFFILCRELVCITVKWTWYNGRDIFFHITSGRINTWKGVNQLKEIFFLNLIIFFYNIYLKLTNHRYFVIKNPLFFTINNKNRVLL